MKKKSHAEFHVPIPYYLKWLLMFKLTVFFLIAFSCSVFANESKAQGTVSFRYQQVTLKNLLLSIEEQTNVSFIYNDNLIKDFRVNDVDVFERPWQEVLSPILEERELTMDFIGNNRAVVRKKSFAQELVASGTIRDAKGQPIASVSVTQKGTQRATLSNSEGQFSLVVDNENVVLQFSYIGYLTEEIPFQRGDMQIVLAEDLAHLEEVVVVGYGTQKRETI